MSTSSGGKAVLHRIEGKERLCVGRHSTEFGGEKFGESSILYGEVSG